MRKIDTVTGPKCVSTVYWNRDFNEYEVRFKYPAPIGYLPECTYFTNCREDALGTARMEAGL